MGSLALTGQPSKQEPFAPLPGDVVHVPYGDTEALAAAVDDATAAVFLEPIMGEGGVVVPPAGYLVAAREITSKHGALLVLDEVQTGMGRTGAFFAHQHDGITPDIVTLAKGSGRRAADRRVPRGRQDRGSAQPRPARQHVRWQPGLHRRGARGAQGARRRRSHRPRRRARQDAQPRHRVAGASARRPRPRPGTAAGCRATRIGGQAGRGGGARRRLPGQRRCAGRDPAGAAAGHHRGADRRLPQGAAGRAGQGNRHR